MLTSYSDDAEPAGFGIRFFAYSIDLLIKAALIIILRIGLRGAGWMYPGGDFYRPLLFNFNIIDITAYIAGALYFILFTYLSGATVGKRFFRLEVAPSGDESVGLVDIIYRETIGRYLSSLLCLGYLYAVVNRQKQGLHDVLANTRVIYAARPYHSSGKKPDTNSAPATREDVNWPYWSKNPNRESEGE